MPNGSSIFPDAVLPFSVIKRNRENCIPNCKACNLVCPANLEIPSDKEGDNATSVNVSPVENVSENVQSKTHIMVFWESYGYQCL